MRYVTNVIYNHEQSDVAAVRYLGQHGLGLHYFTSIIQINVQIVSYPTKYIVMHQICTHAQLSSHLIECSAVQRA